MVGITFGFYYRSILRKLLFQVSLQVKKKTLIEVIERWIYFARRLPIKIVER